MTCKSSSDRRGKLLQNILTKAEKKNLGPNFSRGLKSSISNPRKILTGIFWGALNSRITDCFFKRFIFLKYAQLQCILSYDSSTGMHKFLIKPYTLAGFEPGMLCSVGGRDDHCATPPWLAHKFC
jgi:hypothetical protein